MVGAVAPGLRAMAREASCYRSRTPARCSSVIAITHHPPRRRARCSRAVVRAGLWEAPCRHRSIRAAPAGTLLTPWPALDLRPCFRAESEAERELGVLTHALG